MSDDLLDRCTLLHLTDLRAGSKGTVAPAFRVALAECLAAGRRDVWVRARREAGLRFSRERVAYEDERAKGM